MQPLLKDILIENVNNENIYDIYRFLKNYNQPESYFNDSDFEELYYSLMHKYHNHKNLGSLFEDEKYSKILHNISAGLSLEDFEKEIKRLALIATDRGISLGQFVYNTFNKKIISLSGWFKIYSDRLKGSTINDHTQRIFLAVDNSYLHKFSLLLVQQLELFHIHYQFKINNGDGGNSYDNVVIYLSEEELPIYIKCILNILDKHPEIKINQQCVLAYPFDKNIAVAPYLDTKYESYSQIVCKKIVQFRQKALSLDEFISNVENYFNQTLAPTEKLCEEIRNKLLNNTTEENQLPKIM